MIDVFWEGPVPWQMSGNARCLIAIGACRTDNSDKWWKSCRHVRPGSTMVIQYQMWGKSGSCRSGKIWTFGGDFPGASDSIFWRHLVKDWRWTLKAYLDLFLRQSSNCSTSNAIRQSNHCCSDGSSVAFWENPEDDDKMAFWQRFTREKL